MGFFTKAIEYNKMARSFGALYVMTAELAGKIQQNKSADYSQELALLAYVGRTEIIDRMETYEWNLTTGISVPLISSSKITLMQAYNQTIDVISLLANELDMLEEIQSILEKGEWFDNMDKALPVHLKHILRK